MYRKKNSKYNPNNFFIGSFTFMIKSKSNLYPVLLVFILSLCGMGNIHATPVELRGKVIPMSGVLPATVVLHSYGDESYMPSVIINKDSTFSIKVDVARAGLYYIRIMHTSLDVMLAATEKATNVSITMDGDALRGYQIEKSPENDAYTNFKTLLNLYDGKLISHFRLCAGADSCEGNLHLLLAEYAHQLSLIEKNFKGTYTAEVLCPMKMPVVAKNVKNTTAEFRKGYFEKVDFADSAIFSTPAVKDMMAYYIGYFMDAASISKEKEFLAYFTGKLKSGPVMLHKGTAFFFEDIFSAQMEKMLLMFINWYNTGDNKAAVNNPVLEAKIKNVNQVLPGMPYINLTGTDTGGVAHSLKEVVDRSKCTLLLLWSSECFHCRDEMPFIKEYYAKYHSKGFDIYAMSLEYDAAKWKKFITDNGLSWTNVLTDRNLKPNPVIDYVATTTPTLVLIDSKGSILHRFMQKSKVEDYIVEALK
jgi:thiol-disulfide isomerase/thioredoxin